MSVSTAGIAPQRQAVRPGTVDVPPLPHCAPDVRLLGAYEGSGFRENHYLAARGDGQVVHLSALLYLVLCELHPGRTAEDVARLVSGRLDRQLTAEGVTYLVAKKLVPSGLVLATDPSSGGGPGLPLGPGTAPAKPRANPLLALRLHRVLLSERATRKVAEVMQVMFAPAVISVMLLGLLFIDVLLVMVVDPGLPLGEIFSEPILLLALMGMLLGGTLFHEMGHAAACRYGGGNPGAIGVGVYVIVPAFYTNVTDVYRLGRTARLRTDLGGVYFNGIAAFLFGLGYLATGWAPLLLGVFLMHLEALQQFLPLIRSDGYFILADLVGVPDLFGRIRPVLLSMLPWKSAGPRVKELRTGARIVISTWVLVVVPVLGAALYLLIVQTPTMVVTSIGAVQDQWTGILLSAQSGAWASVVLAALAILLLLVPIAGLSLFLVQLVLRLLVLLRTGIVRVWSLPERRRTYGRHAAKLPAAARS
jgi:putative peptide zinc metalloprotease protein